MATLAAGSTVLGAPVGGHAASDLLPQAPTQSVSPPGELQEQPDMAEVFTADSDARLDAETREKTLTWLLERFPTEAVGAFTAGGFFVDMPKSIALKDNAVLEGRSGIDSVSDGEGRRGLLAAWERMLARGASRYVLHRPDLPEFTLYWLDVRDIHGVVFAVIAGTSPEDMTSADPASTVIAPPPPRITSVRKDERATVTKIDEAFTKILGWDAEEMEGERSLDFLHPDDHALAIENWMEMIMRPGPARRLRQRMRHKDGSWVWFEVTNHNFLGDPDYGCVVCEMVDISEEMSAQEALRSREQLLDRLTASLPVGVFQIDTERKVVFTNDRLVDILGVPAADTVEAQLATVVAEDRQPLERAIATVLADGSNTEVEVGVRLPEGDERRCCTMSFRALSHEDGSVSGAIACVDDVTERARMQDELERRATFDELTGAHNRASVVSALEGYISRRRGKGERAVMFVDLDGFKDVNDRHGHAAGDELLRSVAQRIFDAVRETDIVGRIGGDEFLVVCPDIGGAEPARQLAGRLAEAIHGEPVHAGTADIECRVSVGVTWSAGRRESADALVALADRAMYESKRAGNGIPTFASASAERASDSH